MASTDAPPVLATAATPASSEAPPSATVSSDAAIAASAGAALALVASHLRPSELPKLALAARAVELGSEANADAVEGASQGADTGDDSRVLALISNVESGREESALLLLRPRRRNASRATCEAVLSILPTLRLACVRYSGAATALDIESLLARGVELPPREGAEDSEWLLAAASGAQWLALRSRDTQGVRDLLTLLQGHKESSASASASTSPPRPTHAWLAAYHDDVLPASAPPLFSRFASQPPLPPRPTRSSSPPPDELRLVVGTYNAAGLGPLHSPGARHARARWLARAARAADLVVIALQEGEISQTAYLYHSPGIKEAWAAELALALGEEAPDFALVVAEQHAHLFLFVFVRHPATSDTAGTHPVGERLLRAPPATAAIGVGLGGWLANKGAIGASLRLVLPGAAEGGKEGAATRSEISVAIVATHLPAFEGAPAREARREAWREIERRLLFPAFAMPGASTAAAAGEMRAEVDIMDHDLVIVAGDVNSRLALNNAEVRRVLRREARSPRAAAAAAGPGDTAAVEAEKQGARATYEETLLHFDELRQEMKDGGAWHGWQEMRIDFEPTYKYDLESDVFDSSVKQRTPAWTDRVLWRTPAAGAAALQVRGVEYASEPALQTSDHRPVRAALALQCVRE